MHFHVSKPKRRKRMKSWEQCNFLALCILYFHTKAIIADANDLKTVTTRRTRFQPVAFINTPDSISSFSPRCKKTQSSTSFKYIPFLTPTKHTNNKLSVGIPKKNQSLLYSSSNDYTENEDDILLMIKLSSLNNEELSALLGLQEYVRSIPFAAILPVQPLQYKPSSDGVEVLFLRKKTKEKGSIDGGINIEVKLINQNNSIDDDDHDDDDDNNNNNIHNGPNISLVARRNREGQTVGKMFSEKIVILELIDSLDNAQDNLGVRVISLFHKWM